MMDRQSTFLAPLQSDAPCTVCATASLTSPSLRVFNPSTILCNVGSSSQELDPNVTLQSCKLDGTTLSDILAEDTDQ